MESVQAFSDIQMRELERRSREYHEEYTASLEKRLTDMINENTRQIIGVNAALDDHAKRVTAGLHTVDEAVSRVQTSGEAEMEKLRAFGITRITCYGHCLLTSWGC